MKKASGHITEGHQHMSASRRFAAMVCVAFIPWPWCVSWFPMAGLCGRLSVGVSARVRVCVCGWVGGWVGGWMGGCGCCVLCVCVCVCVCMICTINEADPYAA